MRGNGAKNIVIIKIISHNLLLLLSVLFSVGVSGVGDVVEVGAGFVGYGD